MNGKIVVILCVIGLAACLFMRFALSIKDSLSYITLSLVLVTAYYAIQTGRSVKVVMEQTNKTIEAMREQNRPNIRIHCQVKEKRLYMQISNVGKEYAKNLRCVAKPDFQLNHSKLSDIEIMKLPILFGGEMFEVLLGDAKSIGDIVQKVIIEEEKPKTNEEMKEWKEQENPKANERVKERLEKEPIITCTYTEASGKSRKDEIPLRLYYLARNYLEGTRIEHRFHCS